MNSRKGETRSRKRLSRKEQRRRTVLVFAGMMLVALLLGLLVSLATASAVSAATETTQQVAKSEAAAKASKTYKTKVTTKNKDGKKVVTLWGKWSTEKTWTRRVVTSYNRGLTSEMLVERICSKAVNGVLKSAADKGWGADLKMVRRKTGDVVWEIRFSHKYCEHGKKLKTYKVSSVCAVQVVRKDAKWFTVYYIDGKQVSSQYAIDTLLMRQGTSVNARLGKYAPDIDWSYTAQ